MLSVTPVLSFSCTKDGSQGIVLGKHTTTEPHPQPVTQLVSPSLRMQDLGSVTLLPPKAVRRTGSFHLTSSEPSLNLRVELWRTLVSLCLQMTLEKRTYPHRDVWVREGSPTLLNLPEEEVILCFETIGDFCSVFNTLKTLDSESTI